MSRSGESGERPYDIIVVGAGGAGAPLAARLSEDAGKRVLLLEAGPDYRAATDFPPEILYHPGVSAAVEGNPHNWAFAAHLTADRTSSIPRGRAVGGSTSINGSYFIRATRTDFARWAALGNDEWTYEKSLPYLRRLENDRDYGANEVHGADGPVAVSRDAPLHPITEGFFGACAELGFPEEIDKNAGAPPGYGLLSMNNVAGVRQNTALAYLTPIRNSRGNLTIVGDAFVRRVLFAGLTATGVEVDVEGEKRWITAPQVILAAGAIKSPHLLMLSGIGPREELSSFDIPLVSHLPGVGQDFSDHTHVQVGYRAATTSLSDAGTMHMQGVLSFSSQNSDGGSDLELACLTKPWRLQEPDRLALVVSLNQQSSRGRIGLRSADPHDQPSIEYRSLTHAHDVIRFRIGIRAAARVLGTAAFRPHLGAIVDPPPDVLSDDAALDAWVRANVEASIHLSASCRMGPDDDPGAVVDQFGRVRGVEGLRVADTSILPDAPSRGTAATAVLIGERIAGFISGGD